jgi:hypothetical protein
MAHAGNGATNGNGNGNGHGARPEATRLTAGGAVTSSQLADLEETLRAAVVAQVREEVGSLRRDVHDVIGSKISEALAEIRADQLAVASALEGLTEVVANLNPPATATRPPEARSPAAVTPRAMSLSERMREQIADVGLRRVGRHGPPMAPETPRAAPPAQ